MFPVEAFSKQQIIELNKLIRKAGFDRRLSFYEMFIMLDADNDGCITIGEIYEHFDKIVKLS